LLQTYFRSELADPAIRMFLGEVLAWAAEARATEQFYQQDPWPCIVNTEVNSGNFIVNPSRKTMHLVDWEMPRWGDPSQDLSHFCSPLTTLWKTAYRMTPGDKARFLATYARHIDDASSAGYPAGAGSPARSLCLSAGDIVVGHGVGGLPDGIRRDEKCGHLGDPPALYGHRFYTVPVRAFHAAGVRHDDAEAAGGPKRALVVIGII
jgi:hypothetical protein